MPVVVEGSSQQHIDLWKASGQAGNSRTSAGWVDTATGPAGSQAAMNAYGGSSRNDAYREYDQQPAGSGRSNNGFAYGSGNAGQPQAGLSRPGGPGNGTGSGAANGGGYGEGRDANGMRSNGVYNSSKNNDSSSTLVPPVSAGTRPPQNPGPSSPEEIEASRRIAQTQCEEFRAFLDMEGGKDPNSKATTARDKLARLTRLQFQELSTDVYDELIRRQRNKTAVNGGIDFLPSKNEYHPKRNQARQKLSILPKGRFRDLAFDVFTEMERRYPEFHKSEYPDGATTDHGSPELETTQIPPASSSYGQQAAQRPNFLSSSTNQKRPQFTNGTQGSQQQMSNGAQATGAANEMIIPNKSTLVEEDIRMPQSQDTLHARDVQHMRKGSSSSQTDFHQKRPSEDRHRVPTPLSPTSPTSANGSEPGDRLGQISPGWSNNNKTRGSEASSLGTRLIGGYGANDEDSHHAHQEEIEKLRSDYEYKIATMQSRLRELERDVTEAHDARRAAEHDADDLRGLHSQHEKLQQAHEEALQNLQHLERELADAHDQAQSSRDRATSSARDQDEIARLTDELQTHRRRASASKDLEQKMKDLMKELNEASQREDRLQNEREADQARIQLLEQEVQEWKKRYEMAKTELRSMKTTSQLFVKRMQQDDDYMPTHEDGAIVSSHVTRFQRSIDDLLIFGRSDSPSSVIHATTEVVNAVAEIDKDVQAYEEAGRTASLSQEDSEKLLALKRKCHATLSNLTTAAANHGTGHGLSPVSLLDAAASHLCVTIIDLVRLLHLRKSDAPLAPLSNGSVRSPPSSNKPAPLSTRTNAAYPPRMASLKHDDHSPTSMVNGHSSTFDSSRSRSQTGDRSVSGSVNGRHSRSGPSGSSVGSSHRYENQNNRSVQDDKAPHQHYQDERSQSIGRPEYGESTNMSMTPSQEEDWNQLRAYLEAQTEHIVHSITSLLAAIRGGAQAPTLDENLMEIITTSSQIVSNLQQHLPDHLRDDCETIIRDLSDNCDKLAGMQSSGGEGGTFPKQVKQQMATASFGIAKSLKSLNGLLTAQ